MKGRLLAALLALPLLALIAPVYALPVPTLVTHGIPHQALFDVAFHGAQGYAVGAGGQIMHTADGGKTWNAEKSPTPLSLLGVATSADLTVAVGQMGTILVKDGSNPWAQIPSGTDNRLMRVVIHGNDIVVVGAFGALLRSTDRGQTWQSTAPDWKAMFGAAAKAGTVGFNFKPKLYTCTYNNQDDLFVAGELGLILGSADGGATWKIVRPGTATHDAITPTIFGMSFNDQGVGVAVGQNGSILRSDDNGMTWAPVNSGVTAILLSAVAEKGGNFLVTGAYTVLWSDDGGKSWEQITAKNSKSGLIKSSWYSQAARSPATNGTILVGEAARILRVTP